MAFKHSLVTPLLKKANLDKENLSNYRLISNLSFLSKLPERIVLARLNDYHSSYSFLNPPQSDFIKHHSAETLFVYLANLYLPSAIRKYPTYVSLTSLTHLILEISEFILITTPPTLPWRSLRLRPSIHPSFHSSIHPSIHLSIHLSIH